MSKLSPSNHDTKIQHPMHYQMPGSDISLSGIETSQVKRCDKPMEHRNSSINLAGSQHLALWFIPDFR